MTRILHCDGSGAPLDVVIDRTPTARPETMTETMTSGGRRSWFRENPRKSISMISKWAGWDSNPRPTDYSFRLMNVSSYRRAPKTSTLPLFFFPFSS